LEKQEERLLSVFGGQQGCPSLCPGLWQMGSHFFRFWKMHAKKSSFSSKRSSIMAGFS